MAEVPTDLEDIIEIRDSEINVTEIMAQIRENLARRPTPAIDVSQIRYRPADSPDICPAERLEHNLRQARELKDRVFVGDQLRAPGSAAGRVFQPLKRQIHQLVRFYVDLGSARQVVVNTHLVEALEALVEKSRADEARLRALEEQVQQLTARMAAEPQPTSE